MDTGQDLKARIDQLERSSRRMGLLLKILSTLQGADDLETTLRIILNCVTAGHAIGFNRAFLFLLDEDGKRLRGALAVGPRSAEEAGEIWNDIDARAHSLEDVVAFSRMGGREGDRDLTRLVLSMEIEIGNRTSLLERCVTCGETIVVSEPGEMAEDDILHGLGSRAFVCTPIATRGRAIGLIIADNLITGEKPTEEQISLLKALAYKVGHLISTASHLEDIRRRFQELSTLNEVSKGILSTTDLETDLALVARISAQVLNARGAVLRLLDDETLELVTKAMFGVTIGEVEAASREGAQAMAEKVAKEGKPMLVNNRGTRAESNEALARRGSLVCVPLVAGERVIGTLTVFDKVPGETLGYEGFGRDDVRFLTVLGGQAAIAIENAKLFDNLKKSEERIRELHKHLLRSERLAALGELSSQVAHEIRNPLTAIGGFARSIERRMKPDDPDRSSVEIIIKETDRLERILTEQLTFAKLAPPEFRLEDINLVISETVSLFTEKLKTKRANLEVSLEDGIPQVSIDPDKMKQVFINLLQNAVDNISEGGTIRVASCRRDRTLEVRFANDGPPVGEEILDRLFVPFATTKSSGSGLGLPIAYEIVYEHGGVIDVNSEEGLDTVFVVRLPLVLEGDRRTGPIDRRSMLRDRRRIGRVP